MAEAIATYQIVGVNVDTWILNVKSAGDLNLICQMLAGCSSTAAAFLAGQLPDWDDGANFLSWFHNWMCTYLSGRGLTFEAIRTSKQLRLGVVPVRGTAA